jgi:hypothetical protein
LELARERRALRPLNTSETVRATPHGRHAEPLGWEAVKIESDFSREVSLDARVVRREPRPVGEKWKNEEDRV